MPFLNLYQSVEHFLLAVLNFPTFCPLCWNDMYTKLDCAHRGYQGGERERTHSNSSVFTSLRISPGLTTWHTWSKKSRQCLYFPRRLRKFSMNYQLHYRLVGSTLEDCKALQEVFRAALTISVTAIPILENIYQTWVIRSAHNIA